MTQADYKLVVLGSGGVGKSALTIQLTQKQFVYEYDPTVEDCYRKQKVIDGETCMLEILDTAGQEEFAGAVRDQYMRQGQGFLIVYSITSKASFAEAKYLYERVKRAKEASRDENVCLILVGNKCDLVNERVVSTEEGKACAKQWNCPFFEASAKEDINVDETFYELVREIRKNRKREESKIHKRQCCIAL